MQSSWRDNNDRILDKVGRLRRVGFLIIPVCNVFISFKRQARVSRVSKGEVIDGMPQKKALCALLSLMGDLKQ